MRAILFLGCLSIGFDALACDLCQQGWRVSHYRCAPPTVIIREVRPQCVVETLPVTWTEPRYFTSYQPMQPVVSVVPVYAVPVYEPYYAEKFTVRLSPYDATYTGGWRYRWGCRF